MLGRVKKTGACVCQLTELRWNDQRAQGALANARQPLVPARNHLRVSHTWGGYTAAESAARGASAPVACPM